MLKQLLIYPITLVGLISCASTLDSEQPAERTYWLEPPAVEGGSAEGAALPSLAIAIDAAPGLDTDRMLVLQSGSRLNNYQAARWADNIPDVIESLLIGTLESTGDYARVSGDIGVGPADWRLELHVREFFAVATPSGDADKVHVALNGYVNCQGADHAISLTSRVDIEGERLSRIVASHQAAVHQLFTGLSTRLSQACLADGGALIAVH